MCYGRQSEEKKTRMFKNGRKKENSNLIDPCFAIVPALIKTFSSYLLSWEKQTTNMASEHFLHYQHAVCRQGHCSCYKKVGWYLEEITEQEACLRILLLCRSYTTEEKQKKNFSFIKMSDENMKIPRLHKCNCYCIKAELNASKSTNTYAALPKKCFFCNPKKNGGAGVNESNWYNKVGGRKS